MEIISKPIVIYFIFFICSITIELAICSKDSGQLKHRKQFEEEDYDPQKELFKAHRSKLDQELDALLEIVNDDSNENDASAAIPIKVKKNRYVPTPPTCSSKFKHEKNVIVDSKASIKNGAELLSPIRYISKETAKLGMNALQDNCMKECCDESQCDTALLSMTPGMDGNRCYLFKCNQNCFFIKHNDYVVLRMRSSEQLNDPEIPDVSDVPVTKAKTSLSTYKPKPTTKNDFNAEMMMGGGSMMGNENILIDDLENANRIYFTDKSKAINSTGNMTLAISLLVLGIVIVVTLFLYLIMTTKYLNKKLSNLRRNSKNVDVDGDYLINGMYL